MKSEGKKLYLESVRGLAALAVVFSHIFAAFLPAVIAGPSGAPVQSQLATSLFYGLPFGFLVSGHFAVVIFFVLSGYVLTFLYFKTFDRNILLKQAVKRYIRLGVPVFASVMLSAILLGLGLVLTTKIAGITGSLEAGKVLNFVPTIWTALRDGIYGVFVTGSTIYNPVLWTMRIELLGSFLVFSMAVLFSNFPKRWLFYGLAMVVFWDTYYPCFIAGMALADLFSKQGMVNKIRDFVSAKIAYTGLAIVLFLGAFPLPLTPADVHNTVYRYLILPQISIGNSFKIWQSIGAMLLVFLVLTYVPWQRILSHKALVWLGGVSFGLYLTHYLIVYTVGAALFIHFLPMIGYKPSVLVAAVITIPLALGVAWLWTKYIDRPTIALSRKASAYMMGKKPHKAPEIQPDTKPETQPSLEPEPS